MDQLHEMISKLKELAKEYGRTPTSREFKAHYSSRQILKYGYNNLVKKAGLEPNAASIKLPSIDVTSRPPKILFLDIETSAILAQVWGLFNQNVAINQIVRDWYLISYAAKYSDSEEVHYIDQRYSLPVSCDRQLIEGIHHLISEADIIVAHNAKFDWGKINARVMKYGLDPIHPKVLCTLKMARRLGYGFTSKKLEFLAKELGLTPKESHAKYHGMALWNECLAGNLDAWEEMRTYNIGDIKTLEELFWKLAKYDESISFMIYEMNNKCICGSKDFKKDGLKITASAKKQRFRCRDCGKVYASRIDLSDKDIKKTLFK